MSNLEFSMLWAVTETMLGWLFYPLLVLAVVLTLSLILLLIKERKIVSVRLMHAEIAGFFGGFVGLWVLFVLSKSSITDIAGPMDWVMVGLTYAINFVGTAILYYTAVGYMKKCKGV